MKQWMQMPFSLKRRRLPLQSRSRTMPSPPTKRMQKLERKSEKAHERLDAAREKLPTHKVLKKERVFDEETGKGKTRLHFEDELKKPKGKGKLQFESRENRPQGR